MSEAGLAPWHVVGSSEGAYLACLLAEHDPGLVSRLLLLSPSFNAMDGWLGDVVKKNPDWGKTVRRGRA